MWVGGQRNVPAALPPEKENGTHCCYNQGVINTFILYHACCVRSILDFWMSSTKHEALHCAVFPILLVIRLLFPGLLRDVSDIPSCVVHLRRETEFYTHIKQGSSFTYKSRQPT